VDNFLIFLPASAVVCFGVAVVTVHSMRLAANRLLPESEQISYFLPLNKWDKIIDSYRSLYPRGLLYSIFRVAVIGTAGFGIGIVLGVIWRQAAK
jgi:uncharacterized membrane protein YedE/YeeE